jgi:DNA ligase (NAD+)
VKGLTYLVTNNPESGSSKNVKARELGVKMIDEKYFIEIIEGRIPPSLASSSGDAKKNMQTVSPQLELEI